MHPLLMDAVVTARQDELRRSARHPRSGRRGSPTRAVLRLAAAVRGAGHSHGEER